MTVEFVAKVPTAFPGAVSAYVASATYYPETGTFSLLLTEEGKKYMPELLLSFQRSAGSSVRSHRDHPAPRFVPVRARIMSSAKTPLTRTQARFFAAEAAKTFHLVAHAAKLKAGDRSD